MKYEAHVLKPPLDTYIESIFHFEAFVPDHSIERVVPTGHVFIIFELDGIERSTFNNESLIPIETFSKVWVSGMHRNYISISAHPNSEMLVIQFNPYGTYPFFHTPTESLNETIISAQKLFGNEILNLREEMLKQKTAQAKLTIAAEWIESKFDDSKVPPSELVDVISRLQNEPSESHHKLVEEYSKTQKHLINEFKTFVGLTPKYYHRILRFNEVLRLIQKKETISWTQIAYGCNYTDQSHFIKDFKHFSGFNPTEFIKDDLNYGEANFFPID